MSRWGISTNWLQAYDIPVTKGRFLRLNELDHLDLRGIRFTVNFGAMAEPFQAGRAAHAGIASACLAQNGFTAAPDSLD